MSTLRAKRLGVLIPVRNEGPVIGRRLANLAWIEWPRLPHGTRHRLVVVDDGSEDGSAIFADSLLRREFERDDAIDAELVQNRYRPGKVGAILTGLDALGDVDLVVLGDADVLFGRKCLTELELAFRMRPTLAMGCGAPHYFAKLPDGGSTDGLHRHGVGPAATLYDRVTAWVRECESRSGRLFSVHGQCLAWRKELDLLPHAGLAADDLDLMLQVRALGGARRDVALIPGVDFFEAKTSQADDARAQAMRRARAYVQVLREAPRPRDGFLSRLQLGFYRSAPVWAFEWLLLLVATLLGGLGYLVGRAAVLWAIVALLFGLLLPPGRGLLRLSLLIREARRRESRGPQPDQWEMRRA